MIDPTKPLSITEAEKHTNNRLRPPVSTSWQPGQSGNPHGRPPKDWTWKDLLSEAAEEILETKDKQGKVTGRKALKQLVARKMLTKAASGDTAAARLIMDRMDGMPEQATDITSRGEKIQQLVVVDTKGDK